MCKKWWGAVLEARRGWEEVGGGMAEGEGGEGWGVRGGEVRSGG